ncbi:hypothetical protein Efla_002497 [Eimeria flavescens]
MAASALQFMPAIGTQLAHLGGSHASRYLSNGVVAVRKLGTPSFLFSRNANYRARGAGYSKMEDQTRPRVGSDWKAPSKDGKLLTGLKVNNSMTGEKTEFIPQEGNRINWYGCGPTVYDSAHMGHARTYVAFDIIRRILSDYFGYDVNMVMNITDIDDKIIARSQEQGVNFLNLARHWEKEFFKDMQALNVLLPSVVTRVSEYVPEVLRLIEEIVDNGFAYESQGSVYFDTQRFKGDKIHTYGRMEPGSVADQSRVLEGEGALGVVSSEKRHPCDFALWKKAKPDEPSWDSKWGPGRPGWHIECSAMASTILPFPLDIHSGGIDLRFPHHDNELAQSEAAKNKPQWVNYFLHSGHLHIYGAKMSKSLKNFVTIKECLKQFKPRHIRFLCLMNRWDSPMNYSPDGETMQQAIDVDRGFLNFFSLCKAKLRATSPVSDFEQRWTEEEFRLNTMLRETKKKVRQALLDNFDTPEALVSLQHLVSHTNTYLNTISTVKAPLLKEVATYVMYMLRVFGILTGSDESLNYEGQGEATDAVEPLLQCVGEFREQVRRAATTALREIGSAKRSEEENGAARPTDSAGDFKLLLGLCDELRDKKLPELGILLQDRPDGTFTYRISAKEEVAKELRLKQEEEQKREAAKEEERRKLAEAQAKKERERSIPPAQYFETLQGDQYGTYDEEGVPLTLKDGTELSKSQRKNLLKVLEKHKKIYEKLQTKQQE